MERKDVCCYSLDNIDILQKMCTNKKSWTFEEALFTKKELTFKLFVWCLYSSTVIIEDTSDQHKRLSKQKGGGDGEGMVKVKVLVPRMSNFSNFSPVLQATFDIWTVNHVKEILRGERLEVGNIHFSNQLSGQVQTRVPLLRFYSVFSISNNIC